MRFRARPPFLAPHPHNALPLSVPQPWGAPTCVPTPFFARPRTAPPNALCALFSRVRSVTLTRFPNHPAPPSGPRLRSASGLRVCGLLAVARAHWPAGRISAPSPHAEPQGARWLPTLAKVACMRARLLATRGLCQRLPGRRAWPPRIWHS